MLLVLNSRVPIPIPEGSLGATSLGIPPIHQEQTEWCWAACMQMVLRYDDAANATTECALANSAFGATGCCENPSSNMCNKPLPIVQVSVEWTKVGYSSTFCPTATTFEDIQRQVVENARPVECGLLWSKGGGHAVLIVGCFTDAENQWVDINDPTFMFKRILFSELRSAYKMGQWAKAWTNIRKEQ